MGVPRKGRPSVSNSCTLEEELTEDKPAYVEIRKGGKGRVSLGDKSSFDDLSSLQDPRLNGWASCLAP